MSNASDIAICPACGWTDRLYLALHTADGISRCPLCRSPVEEMTADPPVVIDDNYDPNADTK